jgi:uncharacterized membrane protein YkoI
LGTILKWLRRQWAGEEPPATRLSDSSAIEIAKQAAAGDSQTQLLTMTTVQNRAGRLVWIVGAAVKGRTLEVEIDDQSGHILGMHHRGVR